MIFEFIKFFATIVGGLLALWRLYSNYQENKQAADAEKRDLSRKEALERLRQAANQEDIDSALVDIVNNKP